MPRERKCWASWNFLSHGAAADATAAVCVSYWVQHLQRLPADAPDLFVTLNPTTPPAEGTVHRKLTLAHPEFSFASWEAQRRIPELQGSRGGIYYAGAWCGYGFHEDGMRSAVAVVQHLGLPLPWVPVAAHPKESLADARARAALCKLCAAGVRSGRLRVVWPTGAEDAFGAAEPPPAHAYGVVPSQLAPQPAAAGTSVTAVHLDLPVAQPPPRDVWMAPGPARCACSCTLRVLGTAAYHAVARDGLPGLFQAYAGRHVEVSDLGSLAHVLAANAAALATAAKHLGWQFWLRALWQQADHHAAKAKLAGAVSAVESLIDAQGMLHTFPAGLNPGGA